MYDNRGPPEAMDLATAQALASLVNDVERWNGHPSIGLWQSDNGVRRAGRRARRMTMAAGVSSGTTQSFLLTRTTPAHDIGGGKPVVLAWRSCSTNSAVVQVLHVVQDSGPQETRESTGGRRQSGRPLAT